MMSNDQSHPITASDVYERMNSFDHEIDKIIETTIMPRFCSEHAMTIKHPSNLVKTFTPTEFIKQMEMRGFTTKYECEDRPCGGCYYVIGIPPQGE